MSSAASGRTTNAFSIDLEEWFCTQNLRTLIRFAEWPACESRIERQTEMLLELLARHGTEATFFVVGWIAERHPTLVRRIADAGHEIGSHGYRHLLLTEISPSEFRADLRRAIDATEDTTGRHVLGFRAPAFTVTPRTLWALDIMEEEGLRYDSSIFPIGFHPEYGFSSTPLGMHRRGRSLIEVPLSCAEIAGRRLPIGGGYFRQFPYALTRRLVDRCNNQGRPVIFYLHPWEIDPEFPRLPVGAVARFRHYRNRHTTLPKLERLLHEYTFTSIARLIDCHQPEEWSSDDGLLSYRASDA